MVGVLMLGRTSRGMVSLNAALAMDMEDFDDWVDAAAEVERRIAEAMKG